MIVRTHRPAHRILAGVLNHEEHDGQQKVATVLVLFSGPAPTAAERERRFKHPDCQRAAMPLRGTLNP